MEYNFYELYREYSLPEYNEAVFAKPLLCDLKYDLKEKSETITIGIEYGDEIHSQRLPLGYSFIEFLNINLDTVEKVLDDIRGLKIFENDVTFGEYVQKFDSEKPIRLYDIEKENYIEDVREIKRIIIEAVCGISSLHPYLIKYSQIDYNLWLRHISELERYYSENILMIPESKYKAWHSFINGVREFIGSVEKDVETIKYHRKMADLCLNVSKNDEWNGIALSTRLRIADVYYKMDVDGKSIKTSIKLTVQNKPEHITAAEDDFRQKNDMLIEENGYLRFNIEPPPPVSVLREIYGNCSISIEERIEVTNINEVCLYSLVNMARTETGVKECANCGKYFIPLNRSDTIYCDRIAPQDSSKTCKKYGAEKQYQENLKNDEVAKTYRLIYMRLQMLVKRNPDIIEYKQRYDEFRVLAKQLKSDVKKGRKTRDEFLNWLNKWNKKGSDYYGRED